VGKKSFLSPYILRFPPYFFEIILLASFFLQSSGIYSILVL